MPLPCLSNAAQSWVPAEETQSIIASPFWAQHYRLPLDDDSAAGLAKGLSAADPTEAVAKAVGALPEDRRSLLTATCALLTKVAASEKTKMSVATLAIAFGRTLFPGLDGDNVQSLMEALC